MLQLNVLMSEDYDESSQTFILDEWPLKLEHSLVSLSKWESKYERPFLTASDSRSAEEILDYIRMMDLGGDTPPEVFYRISAEQFDAINTYINSKQTATWFTKSTKPKKSTQTVTSELIYYWITSYEIPWVVETWHLNRLFTLIEVFNEERSTKEKPKRSSAESLAAERRALNEARKQQMGTEG